MLNDRSIGAAKLTPIFMVGCVFTKFLPWIREFIPEERSQSNIGLERGDVIDSFLFPADVATPLESPLPGRIDGNRQASSPSRAPRHRGIPCSAYARHTLQHPAPGRIRSQGRDLRPRLAATPTSPKSADEIFGTIALHHYEARRSGRSNHALNRPHRDREVIRDSDIIQSLEALAISAIFQNFIPQALEHAGRIKDSGQTRRYDHSNFRNPRR